nr:hypothetical protein Q903MT_gene2042 [Picea sitchensis]
MSRGTFGMGIGLNLPSISQSQPFPKPFSKKQSFSVRYGMTKQPGYGYVFPNIRWVVSNFQDTWMDDLNLVGPFNLCPKAGGQAFSGFGRA